ncbi:hypothetical protein RRG08_001811 [Elysia crispata]|uniref:Uncharacterized protein n=1 Tax=Elysia crispata TaxID=231223 RepID=A0AAE0XPM1_9GAST|nr:hypothetical protein RRG08_001811 [Elysia crispata]
MFHDMKQEALGQEKVSVRTNNSDPPYDAVVFIQLRQTSRWRAEQISSRGLREEVPNTTGRKHGGLEEGRDNSIDEVNNSCRDNSIDEVNNSCPDVTGLTSEGDHWPAVFTTDVLYWGQRRLSKKNGCQVRRKPCKSCAPIKCLLLLTLLGVASQEKEGEKSVVCTKSLAHL